MNREQFIADVQSEAPWFVAARDRVSPKVLAERIADARLWVDKLPICVAAALDRPDIVSSLFDEGERLFPRPEIYELKPWEAQDWHRDKDPFEMAFFHGGGKTLEILLKQAGKELSGVVMQEFLAKEVGSALLLGSDRSIVAFRDAMGRDALRKTLDRLGRIGPGATGGAGEIVAARVLNNLRGGDMAPRVLDAVYALDPSLVGQVSRDDGDNVAHYAVDYLSIEGFDLDVEGVLDVFEKHGVDMDHINAQGGDAVDAGGETEGHQVSRRLSDPTGSTRSSCCDPGLDQSVGDQGDLAVLQQETV